MNKNLLLLLPLGIVMAGCAAAPKGDDGDNGPATANCVTDNRPVLMCNPADLGKVTLALGPMQANPPNVCVKPGTTLTVKIAPAPTVKGTVAVAAKNVADTWLNGTNSVDAGFIYIDVPSWVPIGFYPYGFSTNLGTCADPRVDVIPVLMPMEPLEMEQKAE